jgi:hypothetical protein
MCRSNAMCTKPAPKTDGVVVADWLYDVDVYGRPFSALGGQRLPGHLLVTQTAAVEAQNQCTMSGGTRAVEYVLARRLDDRTMYRLAGCARGPQSVTLLGQVREMALTASAAGSG